MWMKVVFRSRIGSFNTNVLFVIFKILCASFVSTVCPSFTLSVVVVVCVAQSRVAILIRV